MAIPLGLLGFFAIWGLGAGCGQLAPQDAPTGSADVDARASQIDDEASASQPDAGVSQVDASVACPLYDPDATSPAPMRHEPPKSYGLGSRDDVPVWELPALDIDALKSEDADAGRDGPFRFATATEVLLTLRSAGSWQTLPDGKLWRLRFHSPNATSLNFGIYRFSMTVGAKLWLYDPGHSVAHGPYMALHATPRGSLWTPIVPGSDAIVEIFVPSCTPDPDIEIGVVNQGYY